MNDSVPVKESRRLTKSLNKR